MLQVLNYQINQNLRPIHNASVSAGVPIPFQMRDRQWWKLITIRDVRILKFLSPCQSTDFDQGSAVSLHPQQERNIASTSVSALNRPASSH